MVIISVILPIYQANVISANAQTIENNSTLNLIDQVDPVKPEKIKISKQRNSQNNTDFKSKNNDLTIEISNGKDIVMTNGKNKLKLKSPILYNQYRCHIYFASLWKPSYNLEPWRPLVTWRQMINQFDSRNNTMCNPK